MLTYETVFITIPTLTEDEEKSVVETFQSIVLDGGGSIHINERMGRRRLAYPIRKHDDGVYTRFLYESSIDVPRELERRMKLSENVLRTLTVKLDGQWSADAKVEAVQIKERWVQEAEEAKRAEEERIEAEKAAAEAAERGETPEGEASSETPAPATEAAPAAENDSAPTAEPAEATPADAPAEIKE